MYNKVDIVTLKRFHHQNQINNIQNGYISAIMPLEKKVSKFESWTKQSALVFKLGCKLADIWQFCSFRLISLYAPFVKYDQNKVLTSRPINYFTFVFKDINRPNTCKFNIWFTLFMHDKCYHIYRSWKT